MRTTNLLLVLVLAACGGTGAPAAEQAEETEEPAGDGERALVAAALVDFLRGEGALDPALLADTVTLRVAPEGGGGTRRVAREELGDRRAWAVGDILIPPASATLTELTTRPGAHFNCIERPLGDVAPDLAGRPHVGAMLRPAEAGSCLQSWNATFVFAEGDTAVVTDVVYDQWEW